MAMSCVANGPRLDPATRWSIRR